MTDTPTPREARRQRATIGYVRNRLPGRKRIENLRRIALELHIEADALGVLHPQVYGLRRDAATLSAIADQIDEIRRELRGPDRNERARVGRAWTEEEVLADVELVCRSAVREAQEMLRRLGEFYSTHIDEIREEQRA